VADTGTSSIACSPIDDWSTATSSAVAPDAAAAMLHVVTPADARNKSHFPCHGRSRTINPVLEGCTNQPPAPEQGSRREVVGQTPWSSFPLVTRAGSACKDCGIHPPCSNARTWLAGASGALSCQSGGWTGFGAHKAPSEGGRCISCPFPQSGGAFLAICSGCCQRRALSLCTHTCSVHNKRGRGPCLISTSPNSVDNADRISTSKLHTAAAEGRLCTLSPEQRHHMIIVLDE
jgi:hypothetical protein